MDRVRFLILFFLIISFTTGVYADSLKAGDKLPPSKVQDLKKVPKNLSDYKDKILIVDFWATWCVPCVKEFPHLEKFYKKYKDKDVELIAISVDSDLKKVQKFVTKNDYTFTILHDIDHETAKSFKIGLIPTLFIVGKDGKIKEDPLVGGKRNIDEILEEKIKNLLDK